MLVEPKVEHLLGVGAGASPQSEWAGTYTVNSVWRNREESLDNSSGNPPAFPRECLQDPVTIEFPEGLQQEYFRWIPRIQKIAYFP